MVALGLGRRSSYMASGAGGAVGSSEGREEREAVGRASAAAKADPELQRLLRKPEVAAALERIASDPSAITEFAGSPDVSAALQRLQDKLE